MLRSLDSLSFEDDEEEEEWEEEQPPEKEKRKGDVGRVHGPMSAMHKEKIRAALKGMTHF
jgi:hypothetical protein